jgi:hypothetical protein
MKKYSQETPQFVDEGDDDDDDDGDDDDGPPEAECIKTYEIYRMYLDEGQTREVSRMYAGLS